MAQRPYPIRELRVVRADSTTVAERPEVLAGVEREACGCAERARPLAAPGRAMRLRRIFDQGQAVAGREFAQCVHVAALAVQVDGEDGSGSLGDRRGRGLGIDEAGAVVYV